MKAISLWQPWATLWVLKIKKYETRHWPFPDWHKGPVAIHAAKKTIKLEDMGDYWMEGVLTALNKAGVDYPDLPKGAIIGFCKQITSYKITWRQGDDLEDMLGDWSLGRYCWKADNMATLKYPVQFTGRQGLFNIPDELIYDDYLHKGPRQMDLFTAT